MQQGEAGWFCSRVDPLACRTTASGRRLDVALPLCHQKPSMVDDSECRRLVPAFAHWSEEVAVPPIEHEGRREHQMVKGFFPGRGERNVSVGHSPRSSGGLFMVG